MLTKVGSLVKISSAIAEAPIDLKIDKVIESKKENFIYIRSRSISAGDQGPKGTKWNYNGNLDYFSKKELLKAYATFCGRSLFLNHNTDSPLKAVGKVLDAYPVTDPETNEFYIETLSRVDKELHPELAAMILNGDLNSVSMGASCGASMCSICGVTIHSDQDNRCWHMSRLGQKFAAEVDMPEYSIKKGEDTPAFCLNSELTFSELSIVSVPADSAALIKTVIAGFRDRLKKTAAKQSPEATTILAELESLFSLLPKEAQEDIKKQICGEIGSCKVDSSNLKNQMEKPIMENKSDKKATIKIEAAAYDVLVHALNQADDGTMASLDLFNAMEGAGFTAGRTKDGKHERQVFYTALHSAIGKGWVAQVEPGVYNLTDAGKKRAAEVGEWMGEDIWPGKGKLGPKKDKKDAPAEAPAAEAPEMSDTPEMPEAKVPDQSEMIHSDEPEAQPEAAPLMEKVPEAPKAEAPKPEAPDHNPGCECEECTAAREAVSASKKPNLVARAVSMIDSILQKLSGLEYEKLQEHVAQKLKPRDIDMTNLKAEPAKEVAKVADVPANLKPHEEGMPEAKPAEAAKAEDMAKDLPAPAKEEKGKDAHEAKEVKEEKDEIQKLDEASKLIKEVKEEIKEELKDNKEELAPEKDLKMETPIPKMPELPAMAAAKPTLSAKFTRAPFLSKSYWTVFAGEKPVLQASLGDICGKHLAEMRTLVVSASYGDRLIARIQADGMDKIAKLLNAKVPVASEKAPEIVKEAAKDLEPHAEIKTSYEAGEHLVAKVEEKAEVAKAAAKDSPETLSQAEKSAAEPEGAKPGQAWDKSKSLFNSDKVPSDEQKAKEIGVEGDAPKAKNSSDSVKTDYNLGKEAKLEKGEMSLSEAEKAAAHPAGGNKSDLMTPLSDEAKNKEVGNDEDTAAGKSSSKAVKTVYEAGDAGKEVKAELEASKQKIQQLEADLAARGTLLQQEKMERSLEAKMVKCRKLVEEMVKKDVLAENQGLIEKYVKEGQNLLDARKSALKETIDLQLAAFMQMPDSLLKVQAETFSRMKKTAAPAPSYLKVPLQGKFDPDASDSDWMNSLPWS